MIQLGAYFAARYIQTRKALRAALEERTFQRLLNAQMDQDDIVCDDYCTTYEQTGIICTRYDCPVKQRYTEPISPDDSEG